MKAILVIKEMPKDCVYCPCWRGGNDDFPFDDCTAMQRPLTVDERDSKPDWCPLKPLPDRQKVKASAGGYTRGFTAGFNKFRYLIAGEENEDESNTCD